MRSLSKLLLPIAALVIASACGRRTVQPRFVEQSLDTVVRCGVVPCDISYRFLAIENARRSESLAAIENANINHFFGLDNFTGSADEASRYFIGRLVADLAVDTLYNPDMRYTVRIVASQQPVDTLTVYRIRSEYYTGGAHGLRTTQYHNYWTKGGYELSLEDLFTADELLQLTPRIVAKLCEQYGVADAEGLASEGFFPEEIAPTENFEVTPEGIIFHYNPYDIACYAAGAIDVAFTSDELNF